MLLHRHHVIPKHMGGTDAPNNLLTCNVAMHAFLHKCLWETFGRWQDYVAWHAISGHIGKDEINALVWYNTGKATKNRKRKPRTDAHRHNLSIALQGRTLPAETRQKLAVLASRRKNNLGKRWSTEHRSKISKALIGNTNNAGHKNNLGHKWTQDMKDRMSALKRQRKRN